MALPYRSLDKIRIASPCQASWEAMAGDGHVRFCSECNHNVYNLSDMTREEAQDLVRKSEGRTCVRFYQRADGTVLTRDCPVGLRTWRRRMVMACTAVAVLVITMFAGSMALLFSSDSADEAPRSEMSRRVWESFFPNPKPPVVMGKF